MVHVVPEPPALVHICQVARSPSPSWRKIESLAPSGAMTFALKLAAVAAEQLRMKSIVPLQPPHAGPQAHPVFGGPGSSTYGGVADAWFTNAPVTNQSAAVAGLAVSAHWPHWWQTSFA